MGSVSSETSEASRDLRYREQLAAAEPCSGCGGPLVAARPAPGWRVGPLICAPCWRVLFPPLRLVSAT